MGDFVTKKRMPVADNHLELFNSKTDVEHKATANGTADDFCLYSIADAIEFESQSENVFALKDKATKLKLPKQQKKVVYKISRKRSAQNNK